ncbi:Zeta toxin domain [Macleaya cordata]|uniref:Zeta toxin domain n=1 Tax=Macleaya cordata TaxID=56857 RepID=A0A200QDR7_MACCD|nr:Zeta toxin domain [Macleaya cordata]
MEEIKAIGTTSNDEENATDRKDVMAPVAHSERSPVLLFKGGGMGAGKSTVLKDILKESFWSGAAEKAVVVEADAFKETDVIYRALSSKGHHDDMLQTAELVPNGSRIQSCQGRYNNRKLLGTTEQEQEAANNKRKPYRIELVGVVCDAYLAVVRGIRRDILMGRAVRVKSQLRSHKRFANAFPKYCHLVDNARLYCTNSMGTPPKNACQSLDVSLIVDLHRRSEFPLEPVIIESLEFLAVPVPVPKYVEPKPRNKFQFSFVPK